MQITGGKYNSRKVQTAQYSNIKPTLSKIRQGIFNTLSSMLDFENKIFFDLFSGSGIMSFEAFSRGFRVISFERDKRTALSIINAFNNFGLSPELYVGNSIKKITEINLQADVIFIDPPYQSDLYEQALNVIKLNNKLKSNGIIVIEHPVNKKIDIFDFELIKSKSYGNKEITYIINK